MGVATAVASGGQTVSEFAHVLEKISSADPLIVWHWRTLWLVIFSGGVFDADRGDRLGLVTLSIPNFRVSSLAWTLIVDIHGRILRKTFVPFGTVSRERPGGSK